MKNKNLKVIFLSLAPLLVVILLSLLVGRFGISKVTETRNLVKSLQKDQTVLTQKLKLLQSISETLAQGSGFVITALPGENPSLSVISQVKRIAPENSISLSNIKAGPEVQDKSGFSRVDVSFEALGPRGNILGFLKGIQKISPIALVDKVKIVESLGIAKATITLKSFWSPLPKSIPAVNQVITDLSTQERNVLGIVTGLLQPVLTNVAPSANSRVDPFSP